MPECENPLWPCAMTGAAACLAGFEGIAVVIHGSSGCYYYPTTLLHAPLHGTFILENEAIFGSELRLREVVEGISKFGKKIAVITTCVPALLGEDIRSMLNEFDVILVDSPGFSGDVEAGYKKALGVLEPAVDPYTAGINIDGACLFDPFSCGNVRELRRLLGNASVPVGTVFCADELRNVEHAAPFTLGTNGDFSSGVGKFLGGTLGFEELRETFNRVASVCPNADISPVEKEMQHEDERIVKACDKFLRRFDPPNAVLFGGFSYVTFAARTLNRYLDADILFVGSRNNPGTFPFPSGHVQGLSEVRALIEHYDPGLIIGSSFERSVAMNRAFVGLTPPLRGIVQLAPPSVAGITGTLSFVENVLNACLDRKK
ncbi:MAG: nitrogenase component 1 [Methanoregula sp.]|nr:nitrogenase component 1 [Methanoregula sp.]